MQIAGIDLAWQSRKNSTAVVIGKLQGIELTLSNISVGVFSINSIVNQLAGDTSVQGVAIDAPLIIKNKTGQRHCEKFLSREYGARKASCHAANTALYPDSDSVCLAEILESKGFKHLGTTSGKWQIECYPHPALIELFGLEERHSYKKGKVDDKKNGQVSLAKMLLALAKSKTLSLHVPTEFTEPFDEGHIRGLSGAKLKQNEDILDAVICVYVAGLYASGVTKKIFGDATTGYIYVPQQTCTINPQK